MLLDLVEVKQILAALMLALMPSILDHSECEQALALTHGTPACWTVWPSVQSRGRNLRNLEYRTKYLFCLGEKSLRQALPSLGLLSY